MEHNFNHNTMPIKPPPAPNTKYIPPGKFIDIDEQYYSNTNSNLNHQPEVFGLMGTPLKPYGENVNYNPTSFIQQPSGLSKLKINYGSYIYNQITGWDASHPSD